MFGRKKKNKNALTPAGEKALVQIDAQTERVRPERSVKSEHKLPDPYFTKLSKVTRWTRNVVMVILVVFTVAMAFIFSNEITGEKLKLLMRNASFSFPGEKVDYTTVRYDADRTMDFCAYREYFAVCTGSGLRLYDHRGNIALHEKTVMNDPVLDSGQDYILMYDREGKKYLVCNSVTALYEGSEPFPIYCANVCDNGRYMILTSSSSYLCVVRIYNRSFKLMTEISVDSYPISAELSDDGNRLVLLCVSYGKDGLCEGHVRFYDLSGGTRLTGDVQTSGVPLAGKLTEKGAAVVYEDRICFYGTGGALHGGASFGGRKPQFCCFDKKTAAVSFASGGVLFENCIVCYDLENEEVRTSVAHTGRIGKLELTGDLLFICDNDRERVIDLVTGKERTMTDPCPERIFAGVNDTVFFCYSDKAENVRKSVEITELLDGRPEEDASGTAQTDLPAGSGETERTNNL